MAATRKAEVTAIGRPESCDPTIDAAKWRAPRLRWRSTLVAGSVVLLGGLIPAVAAANLVGPQRTGLAGGQSMYDRLFWIDGTAAGSGLLAPALRVDANPASDGAAAPNVAEILSNASSDSSNALSVESNNVKDTAVGISGVESGRGTVKITHENTGAAGADASASAVSLNLTSSSGATAAQGIFMDAPAGTTGKLLNLRNTKDEKFVVGPQGQLTVREVSPAPAAPAADRATVYTRDNGVGKTQLVVQFNTGPPVVVATQP